MASGPSLEVVVNHRWAATGPSPASLQTVERLQGARLVPQLGHTASVTSAAYSPDGQHIVTASWDGTVPLWDAGSSSWLLTRMSFRDGSWAVVDPEGRFDAANDGDVDGLAWVLDGEPYALSQLRDRYYDPGLMAKVLGASDEPLRNVPPLAPPSRPPACTSTSKRRRGGLTLQLQD